MKKDLVHLRTADFNSVSNKKCWLFNIFLKTLVNNEKSAECKYESVWCIEYVLFDFSSLYRLFTALHFLDAYASFLYSQHFTRAHRINFHSVMAEVPWHWLTDHYFICNSVILFIANECFYLAKGHIWKELHILTNTSPNLILTRLLAGGYLNYRSTLVHIDYCSYYSEIVISGCSTWCVRLS